MMALLGSAILYLCMKCHEHARRQSSFLPWQAEQDEEVISGHIKLWTDPLNEQQNTFLKPDIKVVYMICEI